jgi:hypothetical protein
MDGRENYLVTRRRALRLVAGATVAARASWGVGQQAAPAVGAAHGISTEQDAFLDEMERRGCQYFWDHASAKTGQVKDRGKATGPDPRKVASIAATGFGLTALCVADKRGYLPAGDIRARVLATLDYHAHKLKQDHGFYYHFSDMETGERMWNCEISSIDTSLFLCGVLMCRAYFTGAGAEQQIRELATLIYERVDWPWMLNGGQPGALIYSMGYKPDSGFLNARWSTYSELMMIYLLGIGSPTHGVTAKTWAAFARPYIDYAGFHFISDRAPIFTHQYSHAWFDFRGRHDSFTDYFANSILATRAHKAFCLAHGKPYSDSYWGISASDSAHGYTVWGGPPAMGEIDGSVVPCAAAGSLVFMPQDCLAVLTALQKNYPKAWGRYGFVDAFNGPAGWYDEDVLGIDQGIGVLMAENLRSRFIWDTFMKNPEAGKAMAAAGFVANG